MTAKRTPKAFTGDDAVGEAMRQINPDVVPAYPITPQTEIMHHFAKYVADGSVQTELILVESEHSAMSACVGSSAAGARTMTATAANGLALMWEVVYIAASTRLPIVMNVVNRALSGPINIHCDHSDSMGCRDSGWIQMYSENAQEAYDQTIMAIRIAEHPELLTPVMVCQDGFITSHAVERVDILEDAAVQKWVGEFVPRYSLLNVDKPHTVGPLDLYDYYFEHKRQQMDALEQSKTIIKQIFDEYEQFTGKKFDFIEKYQLDDAETAIVCLSSSCGTIKALIDRERAKGRKIGLLKIRVFRPFMPEMITEALKNMKSVAVLDRSASFGGFGGPVFNEIRSAMFELEQKPTIINYIYGLGGREFTMELAETVYNELDLAKDGKIGFKVRCLGVREDGQP